MTRPLPLSRCAAGSLWSGWAPEPRATTASPWLAPGLIAVLAMPPALLFLYMLVNDREIMGTLVSPLWANVLALGVVTVLIGAGLLFGISVIAARALAFVGGT